MDVQTKREREKTMVSEMIALYGRKNHGTKKEGNTFYQSIFP